MSNQLGIQKIIIKIDLYTTSKAYPSHEIISGPS